MDDHPSAECSELAFLRKRVAELETRETQLRAGYEHLKLLYERAPLSYQSLDESGCFIEVNQAWLETLGYTREEVIGKNFGTFLHPDWTEHFHENFPKFKAIGEILGIEFEMVRKDGQSILVSFTGKVGKDTQGRFQQTHCIFQDITERKRAETELVTSEARLRSIIDIVPIPMAFNDEQHNVTFLNPAFVQAFGYTLEDIPTLAHWWPLAYPDPAYRTQVAGAWQAELERARRTGAAFSPQEVTLRCKDLTCKTVLINAASIADTFAGNHLVLLYDITERKQASEALRESEQNFRTLSNSGQALIWTSGTDTLCNYFNTVWLAFTGRTLAQEMGNGWTEGVHPDDMQRCVAIYLGAFDRRQKFSMEYRLRRHDGAYRWLLDDGCPRYDSKGAFLGYIGHCLDITRRKRAEEESQRNETRLKKLVDILQHRSDTIQDLLDYALAQALELTESKIGYIYHYHEERKELVLNSWSQDVLPACAVANPQSCYALAKTGIWGEAVRQRRPLIVNDFPAANPLKKGCPEGHVHLLKFVTIPIFKGERIVSVVGLANKETDYDATDVLQISLLMDAVWKVTDSMQSEMEKVKLQAQLLQSQKMEAIGTLAGGIAHDFNNILSAILGYAELARESIPLAATAAKDVEEVLKAGHRAASLVKQILAFSRQATGERSPLQPASIINEAISLLRSSLPATIVIRQQIDDNTKAIVADPTQVHQIVINLCTNAFHAMEQSGGTLDIALADCEFSQADLHKYPDVLPGSFVALSIGDTGSGIDPEILSRIFDPYFTTKDVGKGSGMGLAIVHGIVTSYGGFITCAKKLGNGTVFRVFFPAFAQEAVAEVVSVEDVPCGTERILFVDDEEMLAELGKAMLEQLGYTVTALTSGAEALAIFADQPDSFDAVFTDQTMPGMTGMDLARQMLQIRPDMPIVLCTGYSSLINEAQAKSGGLKGFVAKPMTRKAIAALLRKVLDESTAAG